MGGQFSGASPCPQVTTLPFRCDGLWAATLPAASFSFLFLRPESMNNFTSLFFLNLDWKWQTGQMICKILKIFSVSSQALNNGQHHNTFLRLAVQATVVICSGWTQSERWPNKTAWKEGRRREEEKGNPTGGTMGIKSDLFLLESTNPGWGSPGQRSVTSDWKNPWGEE